MRLIFFIILALVFFAPLTSGHPVDANRAVILTSLVLLLMGLTAELPSSYLVHRILRHPDRRYEWARLFRRLRHLHLACAIGMYFTTLIFFDWPSVVRINWHLDRGVILDEILILFPFVLGLFASWASFYRVERALHLTSDWSALEPLENQTQFLWTKARYHLALLLEPLLVFAVIQGGIRAFDAGWSWPALVGYGLAGLLTIAIVLPWAWTKLWGTYSLPSGTVRSQLMEAADRVGVRCTDFLMWPTHGNHAVAMIVGYLPWPRYVIFSDVLLDNLSNEELEAILAHELGHIHRHHLVTLLLYTLVSVLLWSSLGFLCAKWAGELASWDRLFLQMMLMVGIGLYVRITLGWLSRLLEREADLMGCIAWHDRSSAHGLAVFAGALHRVAQLNGEAPERRSWLHGSVIERTGILQCLLEDDYALNRFQHRMILLKTGLVAGVLTLGVWAFWMWYST